MSSPPKALRTSSATFFWPAASPVSDWMTSTSLPSSLRAASMPFGLLPVTATLAPSARNCLAVSKPMPLVPPVIRARLPFNLLITVLLY
jgi:hypothetical protein